MRRKIFWPVFLTAAAFIVICSAVISAVLSAWLEASARERLSLQMDMLSSSFELPENAGQADPANDGFRITVISAGGEVLYDSAGIDDDYFSYEDVRQAAETGSGEYEYNTENAMRLVICRSQRLSDGSVLRVCAQQLSVWGILVLIALPTALTAILLALIASLSASKAVSYSISKKINGINLDTPLESDEYDEITPLLTRIERNNRRVRRRVDKLKRRRSEFYAVTEGMTEGLILLGKDNIILSINKSAEQLFDTDDSCKGQNILTVYRSTAMQEIIDKAWLGEHGETALQISGREYRLSASPVASDGETTGVCMLAFDITDRAQAERMRREFTANVSHELKTPLHSIMGTAELMENGLVKPEDAQHFIGSIRREAQHLVALVNDIIRLSQLDENTDFPKEYVSLKELSEEVVSVLSDAAADKEISVEISGSDAVVFGVRRLIYEIIYNLCDNAVKYNVQGGSVKVVTEERDGIVRLTVSDTGIGIPKEYQSRIFERFYRVDKSHSRATGGTGLGLSIVKHAVEYHHARLSMVSDEGKGTAITVEFPKG